MEGPKGEGDIREFFVLEESLGPVTNTVSYNYSGAIQELFPEFESSPQKPQLLRN